MRFHNSILCVSFSLCCFISGCSESAHDRLGAGDGLGGTATGSFVGTSYPDEIETAHAEPDAIDSNIDFDGLPDSAFPSENEDKDTQNEGENVIFDTVSWVELDSQDQDSQADSETGTDGCPLNSGYPCACDSAVCDDGSDCLAYGDSLTGFCSRTCGGNRDEHICDTNIYGLPRDSNGACAFVAQQGSRGADHCVVVCRDGGSTGDCPSDLVCTTAEEDGLGYCLPPQPGGED